MNYLIIIIVVFPVSIILNYFFKKIGKKYNLCDEAGRDRLKIHTQPIPYLGGVAVFLSSLTSLFIINTLIIKIPWTPIIGFSISGLIVIVLGLWDDIKLKKQKPRPLLRLTGQIVSAFIIFLILINMGINFDFSINFILLLFISVFYYVGAMNAMNMEDGINGLAGSLALISFIGFALLSIISNNPLALILSLSLAGATLGFLFYNWDPASIFMGDSGSHFLGFSLVVLAILFTRNPLDNWQWFVAPLFIIGLPIIEAAAAILRRLIRGQSPFLGDRKHLYDLLHQKGLTIKQTVLVCCFIQTTIVTVGLIILI